MFYSLFILMPHLTSQKTREDHFTRTSEHHHHIYETLQPTYRPHQFAELKRKKKPVYNIIEKLTFNILGLRLRDKTFHRALFPRILSLRECLFKCRYFQFQNDILIFSNTFATKASVRPSKMLWHTVETPHMLSAIVSPIALLGNSRRKNSW